MNYKIREREEMLIRVLDYLKDHGDILPPAAAALIPQIAAGLDAIQAAKERQIAGKGTWRFEAAGRQELGRLLRQALVDLAQTGRILARKSHPSLVGHFRLKRKMSFSELETMGAVFVELLTPVKEIFIERGFNPGFLEEVSGLVAALREAAERKYAGIDQRIQGTLGLEITTRETVALVRDLDAMLTPRLRKMNPALLGSWKTALRLRKRAKAAKTAKAGEPEPSATLDGSGRESHCAGVEAGRSRSDRRPARTHSEKIGAARGRERIPLRAT